MNRLPPLSLFLPVANRSRQQAVQRPVSALLRLVLIVETWFETARSRKDLARLNPRQLADIGLSQAQAEHESEKFFWQK